MYNLFFLHIVQYLPLKLSDMSSKAERAIDLAMRLLKSQNRHRDLVLLRLHQL